MELKVRRFGNSLGVVLPKEVINRLRTGGGQTVFLTEGPDGSYLLLPGLGSIKRLFGWRKSGRASVETAAVPTIRIVECR